MSRTRTAQAGIDRSRPGPRTEHVRSDLDGLGLGERCRLGSRAGQEEAYHSDARGRGRGRHLWQLQTSPALSRWLLSWLLRRLSCGRRRPQGPRSARAARSAGAGAAFLAGASPHTVYLPIVYREAEWIARNCPCYPTWGRNTSQFSAHNFPVHLAGMLGGPAQGHLALAPLPGLLLLANIPCFSKVLIRPAASKCRCHHHHTDPAPGMLSSIALNV